MKFKAFLKDHLLFLIVFGLFFLFWLLLCLAFKLQLELVLAFSFLFCFPFVFYFVFDYWRKRNFYQAFIQNIERLDKKYYVLETLEVPSFYEGQILYQGLYETHKAMIEHLKEYKRQLESFKDYIEMWIHEVKIPLATLTLMVHNHYNHDRKLLNQLKEIEDYLDQVLYYARMESAEKDYLIKENSLKEIVNDVLVKNKDVLLENKITLEVDHNDALVYTDAKWLSFILNQILGNSIKYADEQKEKKIQITITAYDRQVLLQIKDNGIGIAKNDLPSVFAKSFTGQNGRMKRKSTGMGLYISKKLCMKLGHKIEIFSELGNYTEVVITFANPDYYEVLK